MPLKNERLTARERIFAKHYAVTGDHVYAATKAGYAVPASGGSQNLQKPLVQKDVRRQQMARLQDVLVPLALDHAEDVLSDPERPDREKTLVMKAVLDQAHKLKNESAELEPHELSGEELARRADEARLAIIEWRNEQARRAVDITPEPQRAAYIEHAVGVFD